METGGKNPCGEKGLQRGKALGQGHEGEWWYFPCTVPASGSAMGRDAMKGQQRTLGQAGDPATVEQGPGSTGGSSHSCPWVSNLPPYCVGDPFMLAQSCTSL